MVFRIVFFLSFLFSQNALAQDPYTINYTINEGFPSNTIYSANQDEKGFLWFTTDVGLVKFDSHKFELFNTDKGISDNEIFQMKTDFKGRTWLLTLSGKLSFIYKNKIYNENNSSLIKQVSGSGIAADFYEDKNHFIYITFRNSQITIINPKNEVAKQKITKNSLAGIWKYHNTICVITGEGIYNSATRKKIKPFEKQSFFKIHHTQYGDYLSDTNILYKINADNDFSKIIELPNQPEILNIYLETENKIWISTRNGLFLINNSTLVNSYFNDYAITSIIKDFEGGYWVSTLKNGLFYVPSFDILIDKMEVKEQLKINCISINSKKEIWVGGDNNNYYVKKPKQRFERKIAFVNKKKDLVTNIRFYDNDTYVIGKNGVNKIDNKNNVTNYNFSSNDILINDKQFYIGYTYAYKFSIEKPENFNADYINSKIILNKRVTTLSEGNDNQVWIGSNFGLFQYTKKDSIQYWGDKSAIFQTSIEDIYYDKNTKTVFVATASKGIVAIQNNKIKFQINKGLNSNTCNSIKKIAETNYLIGTNNGLNLLIFKNKTIEVQNLNAILGLKNNKINDVDFLDNIVYLATDNGLLSFNFKQIIAKKGKPKCHIINIRNQNKIIAENFIFPYNKSDISISFNGISYLNQGNLTYYYKLNSKNNEWTSSKESQINYKLLPPKKYIFSVYAIDGFGIKSNVETIKFEILPPFWQKIWFLILSVIIFSLLLFFFIKYRLKKIQSRFDKEKIIIQNERDKANLEKQMIELEQKALRMQMNPHFIFNALNTIKGYYSEGNDEKAGDYISKFSRLLRMLLENTEQTIPLATEIKMLQLYIDLTKIRYKNAFNYSIEIDEKINQEEVAIPTLLLQPIVENAIIHGLSPKKENGLLLISFYKKENQLECVVKDNGIGRKASAEKQKHKQHESKAIEITKERLNLLEKDENIKSDFTIEDLYDTNNNGMGTIVTISIPFKNIW